LLAAERYEDPEPVNLGNDDELPIRDLVELIVAAVGYEGEIRWYTTKPDGQPRRRVDVTRARERFGFEASVGFDEGLRRTVEWYLANREVAESRDR
ncbi:MAG: GDP-L-fucose synthase, partial [Acidimicrobiaceae bacterium]